MGAEFAVGIINSVVRKLGQVMPQDLFIFREDSEWLQTQLRYLSEFIQAEPLEETAGFDKIEVKEFLSEVSDIALDVEDIVDECAVEHLYTRSTQSCLCRFSGSNFWYKMRRRIKVLKDRISFTVEETRRQGLFHSILHLEQPSTSTDKRRHWPILWPESRVVGIDHKVDEILLLLDSPSVGVIAIVGMGGLGKTILLMHVYSRAKHRYDFSAWIAVSQKFSVRALQLKLAVQLDLEIGAISDFRAAQLIHDKLEGKRCLIVLDDVWRLSLKGDFIQTLGLPTDSDKLCKIVVTTRSGDVAAKMRAHIYEIQKLSEEESWELFCLNAFPDCEGNRPPERVQSLAHQIEEHCCRLPVAVKTVAASLSNSRSISKWEAKLSQFRNEERAENFTMQILKMSYDSLPSHLKCCFAYFSSFPRNTQIYFSTQKYFPRAIDIQIIYQDYLIYLWIAEGFIPHEKEKDQWHTGLNYLHQLVKLCLVKVNTVLGCYTVDDLFLDLVINISKEHKCAFDRPVRETRYRRLIFPKKDMKNDYFSENSLHHQPFLRTISFSHNPGITSIPEHLLDLLRVLRVLDLSSTTITTLPKCVGKLKLLKVLNLSQTKIPEVPDCVRRLKCLQYLDVSGCSNIQRVPDWIGELNSLSHLDVSDCSEELGKSYMPKGISNLAHLRTLRSGWSPLCTQQNEFLDVKDVGNLINLQEISFSLKKVGELRSLENGTLRRLVKMRILRIKNDIVARVGSTEESSLPTFPEKLNVMKDLQQLVLHRFRMSSWVCGMANLTELSLFECSDYSSFQNMPNLQTLALNSDSRSSELPRNFGQLGAFPKLIRMFIFHFPLLGELPELEEGAMECLELLKIEDCPQVNKVPEGLERLRRLKEIVVGKANVELKETLKEGGEVWKKVKENNPRCLIRYSD